MLRDFDTDIASAKDLVFGLEKEPRRGESKQKERNKIRSMLEESFESIDLVGLPYPFDDEANFEALFDERVRHDIAKLCRTPKEFNGQPITGSRMAVLPESLAKELAKLGDSGESLAPKSLFAQMEAMQAAQMSAEVCGNFSGMCETIFASTGPWLEGKLDTQLAHIKDTHCGEDVSTSFEQLLTCPSEFGKLTKVLDEKADKVRSDNRAKLARAEEEYRALGEALCEELCGELKSDEMKRVRRKQMRVLGHRSHCLSPI